MDERSLVKLWCPSLEKRHRSEDICCSTTVELLLMRLMWTGRKLRQRKQSQVSPMSAGRCMDAALWWTKALQEEKDLTST